MNGLKNIAGFRAQRRFLEFLELRIAIDSPREAAEEIAHDAIQGQGAWILTLNLEMVARRTFDLTYRKLLKSVDYALPDGAPIVLACRLCRVARIQERVTGIDISHALLMDKRISRIALIGGMDPEAVAKRFSGQNSERIRTMGGEIDDSPFGVERVFRFIQESNPQLVLIALGVPKQDRIASAIRSRFPAAVIIGIGGSFDILAGFKRRCPVFMRKNGLEWLFRLMSEPRRLWKRYLLQYPFGAFALLKACIFKQPKLIQSQAESSRPNLRAS